MVKTRPYLITRDGVDRLVEAPNPGAALAFVTSDIVTRCDAASGAAVAEFIRNGGKLEQVQVVITAKVEPPVEEKIEHPDTAKETPLESADEIPNAPIEPAEEK